MKPIDIFITAYQREELTANTIAYLKERTSYPYRLFLIDQGGNECFKNDVDYYIGLSKNIGIHAAWNLASSIAESEYFITTDNDIYVPDTRGTLDLGSTYTSFKPDADWLERLVKFIDDRPDYGAISLHPHVFIGAASIDPHDPEDVKERNMCGAVMRIMRTETVRKAGGWEHFIAAGRNHEERTICSRLQTAGYKVGITSRIRAFHPFPPNWGYNKEFTPEMQKHNPDLEQYVQSFGNMDAYDNKTWLPK
jgi:hypothetical protein